jgi:hypothetical protein
MKATVEGVLIAQTFEIEALVSPLEKNGLPDRVDILKDKEREENMPLRRLIAGIAVVLYLNATAAAAMYTIKNPAEKINNPADKMYNPATHVNNPASNIYNPAARMDDPNPLSPPTQPVPQPAATEVLPAKEIKDQPQPKPAIPRKKYHFTTVRAYIDAAKKAFIQDDYRKFLSITEDALRRIHAGTLKASKKARQKLVNYKVLGYGLLEKNEE